MATKYKIATEFSIIDRATTALQKMSLAGGSVSSAWEKGVAKAQMRIDAFGRSVAAASKVAAGLGVGAVSAGIVTATKRYVAFDDAITAAGAKFTDLDVTAADYKNHLEELQQSALAVAGATRFTATDTAGALDKMAMAGFTASQSMSILRGTASMASATGKDLTSAVDMATDALGAFNMMKDEMGNPLDGTALAASLQRVSDVVARGTNMANFGMDEWFEAAKYGAAQFSALGGSVEEFTAIAGILANAGLKGSMGGTAINAMMSRLAAPGEKNGAAVALKKLGVEVFDEMGKMRSFTDILAQFQKGMAGLTMEETAPMLKNIFGMENTKAFQILFSAGADGIREFEAALKSSAGAAENMAASMDKSLKGQIEILLSAVEALGIRFVKAFEQQGSNAIEMITKAVSEFDPAPLINAMVIVVDVVVGAAKAAWALRGVIVAVAGAFVAWQVATTAVALAQRAITAFRVAMAFAKGVQLAYRAATLGTTIAIKGQGIAVTAVKVGMKAYAVGAKIAAAAQWLWNTALAANPIALVVVAIVALIGIILVLTGKWKKVTDAVDGFFAKIRGMKGIGGAILNFLITPLETVWKVVRSVFDIFAAFKAGGFLNGIKMIGLSILEWLVAPLQGVLKILSFIPLIGDLNDKVNNWFEATRASLLAGGGSEDASDGAGGDVSTAAPTRTAAAASSYSREESVTTNRVEIGVADGLTARTAGAASPAVTIKTR